MPATWGYGNASSEPGTMSGWGYIGGLDLFEGVFLAETANPEYSAETAEETYKGTTQIDEYSSETADDAYKATTQIDEYMSEDFSE